MESTDWIEQSSAPGTIRHLVCFSHLRWDFVYQRPQHLLSRCARACQVIIVEEPVYQPVAAPHWDLAVREQGVIVATPVLPNGTTESRLAETQRLLLDELFERFTISDFVAWYYTPMALKFSRHLRPSVVVYDCMDELSAFRGAPLELAQLEQELFAKADVVFTGGASLYEAKRAQHAHVHLFPSSIDAAHFGRARLRTDEPEPEDQRDIPRPRIGFFGVLDERLDIALLKEVAELRRDWHFVVVGPVVKIAAEDLPQASNIHYLGQKSYEQLPDYLAGWDLAMMPFAINESTRFISPTKTPEYLAAGKPVVSTGIRDVVRTYGAAGLVQIASDADSFSLAMDEALAQATPEWLSNVDETLRQGSWDKTWNRMWSLICERRSRPSSKGAGRQAVADRARTGELGVANV